jgi:hypothetical protein
MRSGAIATVRGEFDSIDTTGFPVVESKQGVEVRSTLELGETETDLSGHRVVKGQAAKQDTAMVKTYSITDAGGIDAEADDVRVVTDVADFMCVSGEYIVAESTEKSFVFDLFEAATGTHVEPITIDVESLIRTYRDDESDADAKFWMGGFHNRPGDVDAGDGYGDGDIFEDEGLGDVMWESEKNRIGMEFEFQGERIKVMVTESGYAEVYRPSDFGALRFSRLVEDVLLPHSYGYQ